jgi:hypothetical protein
VGIDEAIERQEWTVLGQRAKIEEKLWVSQDDVSVEKQEPFSGSGQDHCGLQEREPERIARQIDNLDALEARQGSQSLRRTNLDRSAEAGSSQRVDQSRDTR